MDAVDGNVRPGQQHLTIQLLRHFDDGIDVLWPTVHDQLYVASRVGGMMGGNDTKQKCQEGLHSLNKNPARPTSHKRKPSYFPL